jgi:glycosyltransferase involved in cell wall biosynthesis
MIHYITTNGIGNAWVAAELEIMQARGIPTVLHSLRSPHQNFFRSEWASEANRQTRLLYPLPRLGFLMSLLLAPFLFGGRFFAALGNALFAPRESARARRASIFHLGVACHWARTLRKAQAAEPVDLIHVQWIHSAGTVGMYAAWLLDVPYSFTGHAVDLFRDRVALEDKIRRAAFIVCISEFHRQFYLERGARPEQLHIVYCGIDPTSFPYRWEPRAAGRKRVLSVGRLVEKKGFDHLIDACGILKDRGYVLECVIAGDGPLDAELRSQIAARGLEDCVQLTGKAIHQDELPGFLASGDLFAQPCVWSRDNDVDGTPRTLMEAMATGLPSISTRLAGIPDIIEDGRSGLLVEPGDIQGLADAMRRILDDPALAEALSRGGRRQILEKFEINHCLEPLAELFRQYLGPAGSGNSPARVEPLTGTAAP